VKSNFLQRSLTAIFFVIFLLSGVFINKYVFLGVFLLITILSLDEFYKLLKKMTIETLKIPGIIISSLFFISMFLVSYKMLPSEIFIIFIPIILILTLSELYNKKENNFQRLAYTFFGLIYVGLPFAILIKFTTFGINQNGFNFAVLFGFFLTIWANDTGAYIVGSAIGKRRLFERISPKKSWEGSIGGFLFTLISAYILSIFFKDLSLIQWIIFSIIIAIFGTYGDLFESLLKRKAQIKDSGTILPGHGGMLDRFDSVLLASPAIYCF